MPTRYPETFRKLRERGEGALIPFTVIGDPDLKTSFEIVRAMIDGGADILELGLPFSDPIADGPVIQAADQRALRRDIKTDDIIDFLAKIRTVSEIPVGLLVYFNLIHRYGTERFYKHCAEAGVDGILIADMPIEEASPVLPIARKHGVDQVFLVSPLTSEDRMRKILRDVGGFAYLVSRLGVTGVRDDLSAATLPLVRKIRRVTDKPVCVGFGISRPEHVAAVVNAGADGAFIGSGMVKIVQDNLDDREKMLASIRRNVKKLKSAAKKARA